MVKISSLPHLNSQFENKQKEKIKSSLSGKSIYILNVVYSTLRSYWQQLLKFIPFLHPKASDKIFSYTRQFSQALVIFDKGQPVLNEKKSIEQQIQEADEDYQQEEKSLNYILKLKIKETLSLINTTLDPMQVFLNNLSDEAGLNQQKDVFNSAKQGLMTSLDAQVQRLDNYLTTAEVDEDINEIFRTIQSFDKLHLKTIRDVLTVGSLEGKKFNKFRRTFVKMSNTQLGIYKKISIDPYLAALRNNQLKAARTLQNLKQ